MSLDNVENQEINKTLKQLDDTICDSLLIIWEDLFFDFDSIKKSIFEFKKKFTNGWDILFMKEDLSVKVILNNALEIRFYQKDNNLIYFEVIDLVMKEIIQIDSKKNLKNDIISILLDFIWFYFHSQVVEQYKNYVFQQLAKEDLLENFTC